MAYTVSKGLAYIITLYTITSLAVLDHLTTGSNTVVTFDKSNDLMFTFLDKN